MSQDTLTLQYVPLKTVRRWNRNAKRHDLGGLIQSIQKHGFKDPMKFEPQLNNGEGGIVEGNGRDEALEAMQRDHPDQPPRGIAVTEDGKDWLIPILFGVDAPSQAAAEAYGVDHNNLTLMGGDFGLSDIMKLWDSETFNDVLRDLAQQDFLPVSMDAEAVNAILTNDIDLSQFGNVDNPNIRYRYVVDNLYKDEAEKMMADLGKGKVESYRFEEK